MNAQKSTTSKNVPGDSNGGFSAAERQAMKDRAQELKKEARQETKNAELLKDQLAAIAKLDKGEREMAERLHEIVTKTAPELVPKLWYGMPAYAKDGQIVCFFQSASKFDSRYATFGFNEAANLDEGSMWPTAFALTKLTSANEAKIRALVKKAIS